MPDKYPHLFLRNQEKSEKFTSSGSPFERKIPSRPPTHGEVLQKKLEQIWETAKKDKLRRTALSLPTRGGVYVEFESAPDSELITKSLEDYSKNGIRLANIRTKTIPGLTPQKVTLATLFIPEAKEGHFLKKISQFKDELTRNGKPKHDSLMRSIEDIRLAVLDSFWQDDPNLMPKDGSFAWCEIWLCDPAGQAEDGLRRLAGKLGFATSSNALYFPERTVLLGWVDRQQLVNLIESSPSIAEFRRAKETADFFISMDNKEQTEWVEAFRQQLVVDSDPKVAVCVLDTGANNRHTLLAPVLGDKDCHSVDPSWGSHDQNGHGTGMCGLSIYGDLVELLPRSGPVEINHCLESVKILPNQRNNAPELYGYITKQGISRAEIQAPNRIRVGCMAVTSEDCRDRGRPSSWSAALDQLTSGAEDGQQRLFIVSAGNMVDDANLANYPTSNITYSIHDPGQSWNALTVGAITEKCYISDKSFQNHIPLAQPGELSPFSSTSHEWESKWPIKPEIVMEGGNVAKAPDGSTCGHEDLSLLTTGHQPVRSQFQIFSATSAATALASRMAAQIHTEYPDAWPETVRGLMVHTASWSEAIKKQLLPNKSYTKTDYGKLLRYCGYGIPNLANALTCMSNSVTLIAESEIQPYIQKSGGGYATNDMHLYSLPWPKNELLSLGALPVSVRVTLSYFIEPGPGEVGWKDRYRYASHGLRFALNAPHEDLDTFRKRINVAARDDNERAGGSEMARWLIGEARNKGSIHSDIWSSTATEVAACNQIAVFPIIGWWRERHHLNKWASKARYSLLVSITTRETDIDIYTPVATQIGVTIPI